LDQKIRPAGGRRSPRASELRSEAATRIIRFLRGENKKEIKSNERTLAFARMSSNDKIEFLKRKLYRLYNQKLKACEEGLGTNLIDCDINSLEKQIQEIQFDMWE
jgi:predicted site-specific integrase-resolvase